MENIFLTNYLQNKDKLALNLLNSWKCYSFLCTIEDMFRRKSVGQFNTLLLYFDLLVIDIIENGDAPDAMDAFIQVIIPLAFINLPKKSEH